MAKPYSEDLRARVVAAIEAGATRPEVADQYRVSLSSVGRFVRLDRETGSVSAAKFGGYKEFALAGHEALVRQLVAKQPDITLAELVTQLAKKKITIGKSSVSRFLHHLKLSFKQKVCGPPSRIDRTSPQRVRLCKSSDRGWIRSGWFSSTKPPSRRR